MRYESKKETLEIVYSFRVVLGLLLRWFGKERTESLSFVQTPEKATKQFSNCANWVWDSAQMSVNCCVYS
eukprot:3876970-Amphidinium_carterae.1